MPHQFIKIYTAAHFKPYILHCLTNNNNERDKFYVRTYKILKTNLMVTKIMKNTQKLIIINMLIN